MNRCEKWVEKVNLYFSSFFLQKWNIIGEKCEKTKSFYLPVEKTMN